MTFSAIYFNVMAGIRLERDCNKEEGKTEAGIDYLAGDKHTRVGGFTGFWGSFWHSNNDNSVMCPMYKHGSITPTALRQ